MLDRLPDPVLLDLLRQVPQLGLVNHRLLGLAELAMRNRVISYFDYSTQQAEALAADVREHLHLESWHAVEEVAQYDFWFFGPEHIMTSDLASGPRPALRHRHLGPASDEATDTTASTSSSKGNWYVMDGLPWGHSLYMLRWSNHYLEYTTRLRSGRHHLFLDVYVARLHDLSKTRITFVRSPCARQFFASTPPVQWLEVQSHLRTYDEMSATKIYVGMVVVDSNDPSGWADVTLRIENIDWAEPLNGLILNYLYFEQHPSKSHSAIDWVVQRSNFVTPTAALSEIYRRANQRKRRWSAAASVLAASPSSASLPSPTTYQAATLHSSTLSSDSMSPRSASPCSTSLSSVVSDQDSNVYAQPNDLETRAT